MSKMKRQMIKIIFKLRIINSKRGILKLRAKDGKKSSWHFLRLEGGIGQAIS